MTALRVEAARLQERGIVFDAVDGAQLGEKLRTHPEIIHDFFGRNWVVAFAGEEAAAGLGRRLEARRLTELRRRLGDIYEAQIHQLDPGLNVEPHRKDGRNIRKRFVVPDVDPANPFLEPSLEPEERPADGPGWDDRAWQFDEYGDSGKPISFGRSPSEPSETPSLAFDDWLLEGGRAMLISGAPGSGKSTALRCLALDLVRTAELFPRVQEQVGARIPLLIPFAVWSRLTAKEQRAVGLAEVVRETFGAFVPRSELEDSFLEALYDKRLLLLIDGLDEYADEQTARTTLNTIETFVRTNDVFTIATARPAGLRRLGTVSDYWQTARLVELSPRQQREFATKLLGEQDGAAPVPLRVDQFFHQLEHSGRLQSLAGNPLLLHGLLSVASAPDHPAEHAVRVVPRAHQDPAGRASRPACDSRGRSRVPNGGVLGGRRTPGKPSRSWPSRFSSGARTPGSVAVTLGESSRTSWPIRTAASRGRGRRPGPARGN